MKCLVVTSGSVDVDVDASRIDANDEAAKKDRSLLAIR